MIIGLDLSLNSSGVCVKKKNEDPIYYLVVPNMTKKQKAVQHKRVNYVVYDKEMKNIECGIKPDFEAEIGDYMNTKKDGVVETAIEKLLGIIK